ncbi:MXAN_6640 family putative metalloprotease [Marmoricola sp. RAF53]|uniref:MXAN_6640 family putative metalloprotease n=1 Tax=Marmoricola sp. RAF53 TaxID=3233059 RepID=UPI003F9E32BA
MCGITAALVLALVTLVNPVPATARAEDGRHESARAVLRAVGAAFTPARRAPGTRLPYRDVGLLLRELRAARPHLSTSERAAADRYLAGPAATAASSTSCTNSFLGPRTLPTAHFCVRYLAGDEQQAQLTADTLEYVYATEIGTFGFRAPLSDGDGRLDVSITDDLGGQGIYGYCSTTSSADQSPAYCALDDDFSPSQYGAPAINSLRVTAAHEFFHAIQFAYDAGQETWAMEGTAVWAEDEVYPAINDYLQYLRFSPVREPGTPIDSNGTFERYGIVVFWKFLSEYVGDRAVIRRFWQYADAPAGRNARQAVVAALAAYGRSFEAAFARFTAWNTLPPGSYRDRALWPAPAFAGSATLRAGTPRLNATFRLDHLTGTAVLLRPGPRLPVRTRLRVYLNGPARSTAPQALVQLRMRNGTVRYFGVPLDAAGNGGRTVPFDRTKVASAVVTLSNASLAGADGQPFQLGARLVR